MEKKMYYVSCGYCGRNLKTQGNQKYGYNDINIPVFCTEEELDVIAPAIGRGYLADSLVVYDNPECNKYSPYFKMYWDCM